MNHSSILQIHLNGGENSLSGGELSIRIFSLASASSSASPFPLLSKGTSDQKAKSRLRQQVRRLKGRRNLQVNWKAISDKKDWFEKFQGICFLGSVRKVGVREDARVGSSFTTDHYQTAAGIILNHSMSSILKYPYSPFNWDVTFE